MFEDGGLTDPSLHVEGQGGGGLVGVYDSHHRGPEGPGSTLGGDACSVAFHRPSAVSDILQQALAEVTDDPSVGGMFGGQATAAAMDSGVIAIGDLTNDPTGTSGRAFDFVGSVPPEFLGVPTVRIMAVEPLFSGGVSVPTFSYLMETDSSVEKLGISKHLDCIANGSDCVQRIGEGIGHFPVGFGNQGKFLDERQKFADLITAATAIVEPVSECQNAGIVDDGAHGFVLENQQEESTNLVASANIVAPPVNECQSFHLVENSAPNFPLKTASKDGTKGAPLGSSQNPIRIVQQGNRYKSLQNLTPEQLAQITEVVQQQHLIRSSKETGQANVLYNPQTQTKIILRVVNPSEMCIGSTEAVKSVGLTAKRSAGSATQTQNKVRHKRKLRTEQKAPVQQEVLKKVEESKKGPRHRTRYGRLSRPPQYMSSEYKRINRINYVDSEGSEDDFSDEESGKETTKRRKSDFINSNHSDEGVLKRRRHRCDTCDKSYIGSKGLQRHLLLNPSHRNSDNVGNPDVSDSLANQSSCPDNLNETASCGSNPDTSCNAMAGDAPAPPDPSPGIVTRSQLRSTGSRPKVTNQEPSGSTPNNLATQDPVKRKRGRPPSSNKARSRRDKLQELVDQCPDEELLGVVWPRICSSVNLWDFLLLKTAGENSQPDLAAALSEFQELHRQIARTFQENLVPIKTVGIAGGDERNDAEMERSTEEEEIASHGSGVSPGKANIEIRDGDLALCLGLTPGSYELREDASLLPRKLFAPSAVVAPESPVQPSSHVDEMVSQGQVAALPLRKRPRLAENAAESDTAAAAVASDLAAKSDVESRSSLPSGQPVTSAAGENVEPGGVDLVSDGGLLFDRSVNRGENSVASGDVGDPFTKDSVDRSSSRAHESSESSKDVLFDSMAGERQSLKEDRVTDRVAGSVGGDGVTDNVAGSMGGSGVTDRVAGSMDDGTISAEATYNMPFQSSDFQLVYSSVGSQLVSGCSSVDMKAPLFHLTSSYRGDVIDPGNHHNRLSSTSAATSALSELQPVAAGDLLTQPDKSYMLSVTGDQTSGYNGLFAGIGDVVPTPIEAISFLPPEFGETAANFGGHATPSGNTGEVAGGELQTGDAVPTNRDLVFLQNPDGSITVHGQDGIPLEMVQTLMGVEQGGGGGQAVYQDYQHGYAVENWNPLK